MRKVHPEFDMETGTWFDPESGCEAPSLKLLKKILGPRTRIIGYHPAGFKGLRDQNSVTKNRKVVPEAQKVGP